ncbi:MAG: aspartate aminotransferase family protein [Deltaproteobacteria bacterium]|nr:MAG: aspartate aminotransferase family protein [Deltaproteobacteria bacterium]
MRFPEQPTDADTLLARLEALRDDDADWRAGRCFALVYSAGEAHDALLRRAHQALFSENGLNPMAFRSVRHMESDLVRMTADLLHAPPEAAGTVTSGGTESLLLAVLTQRNAAQARRRVKRPEIIAPTSIHVAVEKAAHLFGVRLRLAPLRADHTVDPEAVRRLINRRTVGLLASAPQYPHGVIDPIEALGRIAQAHGLPLHVDACIGGFMLPFIEALGHPLPRWDFRVPGVTSISADLHKYGYTAKGASVLLWQDTDWLRHQFFVSTEWPGGIYASPSLPGTRPAGPIAAAWAGVQALGREGYLDLMRDALEARDRIRDGLRGIEGIRVLGDPPGTLLAFTTSERSLDIYALADLLQARGWHFDRNQSPRSLHLTVMAVHRRTAGEFLSDVADGVERLRRDPSVRSSGTAPMYGMMARLPARGFVRGAVLDAMVGMYGPEPRDPMDSEPQGWMDRAVQKLGGPLLGAADRVGEVRDRLLGRTP